MDNKGFIFTLDSALALIPIFILITAVANIGYSESIYSSQQVRIVHDAQDTLEIMATSKNGLGSTVLQDITSVLSTNNNSEDGIHEAEKIASSFLNKTLANSKYNFMEINVLNETITANGEIKDANDASISLKSCGNYIFKLYIWN